MTYEEILIDHAQMYFPSIVANAVEFIEAGYSELVIKLRDGTSILYDDMDNSIRNLPIDSNNMTDIQCRREFGIRLQKIMYLKGVTQEELSRTTGISQTMISLYITGKNNPTFCKVDKIAKALNCSMDDFRYFY